MATAIDLLRQKLRPDHFSNMSSKFAAIVGYVLETQYTRIEFANITVTTDGGVLGQVVGDCGMNDFLGHVSDLTNNWYNLLDAAGIAGEERRVAEICFQKRIHRL